MIARIDVSGQLHTVLSLFKKDNREVKLAMGFRAHYQIRGTATDQIWQVGNAVCPSVMADILKQCVKVIAPVKEQETVEAEAPQKVASASLQNKFSQKINTRLCCASYPTSEKLVMTRTAV